MAARGVTVRAMVLAAGLMLATPVLSTLGARAAELTDQPTSATVRSVDRSSSPHDPVSGCRLQAPERNAIATVAP
jgi:multisubunit Na+/H+ antiporter MnhG subunit